MVTLSVTRKYLIYNILHICYRVTRYHIYILVFSPI